jgi:ankyrin repeat protein
MNISQKDLNQALLIACLWGKSEAAEILLKNGVDPNATEFNDELGVSTGYNWKGLPMKKTILGRLEDEIDFSKENATAMREYAEGQLKCRELLIKHGAK